MEAPISRRRRVRGAAPETFAGWLRHHYVLIGLLGVLGCAMLAEMPWMPAVGAVRLLQAAVLVVTALLLVGNPYQENVALALTRGPNPALVALLLWSAGSAFFAPYPSYAVARGLLLYLGAGIFFLSAYGLRGSEVRRAVAICLGMGVFVSFVGFFQFGADESGESRSVITASFGNHESLGSFLLLLFPTALALGLERGMDDRGRLAAQATALVLGGALLVTRTRSAWIGAAAALIALALFALPFFRRAHEERDTRRSGARQVGPVVAIALAFVCFLALSQIGPLLSERAATLSMVLDDVGFTDRLRQWNSAARAASERPVAGWGLGAWPVIQSQWTHAGDDVFEVLSRGTGHSNLAHNLWMQWAAETGAVGLGLYVAVLVLALLAMMKAQERAHQPYRDALLKGCIATIVGMAVDAFGSPAHLFPGVLALTWFWLGIGIAACRHTHSQEPALPRTPASSWGVALLAAALAGLAPILTGTYLRAQGAARPRGVLAVRAETFAAADGDRRVWSATFQDAQGASLPTVPGVQWEVVRGKLEDATLSGVNPDDGPPRSALSGRLLPGVPVTIRARYRDDNGHLYQRESTLP